jgi:hypothetical protein
MLAGLGVGWGNTIILSCSLQVGSSTLEIGTVSQKETQPHTATVSIPFADDDHLQGLTM